MAHLFISHGLHLLIALMLLPLSLSSHAVTEYEKGQQYYKTGNYTAAREIWLPLAKQGDGDAALGLAIIYENGLQTPRNARQSTYWYQFAADKGIAEALYDLGIKYFTGSGVRQNYQRAHELWQQAADAGLGSAQAKLAYLYTHGLGISKNKQKALHWYQQASYQGDTEGMYNLSLIYQRGTGVTTDTHQFHYWLKQAAEHDYALAQYDLGLMMLHGIEIDPDHDSAIKLLTSAAEQGHKGARQALLDNAATTDITAPSIPTEIASPSKIIIEPAIVGNDSALQAKPKITARASLSSDRDSSGWMLTQNDKHYTIQLTSTRDQSTAIRYPNRWCCSY